MAVILGKRKRRRDEGEMEKRNGSASDESADEETAKALFQRAFEAKFKPLERTAKSLAKSEEDSSGESAEAESESDWGGFSDDDDVVEIIEHVMLDSHQPSELMSEKKSFMSSKPPTAETTTKPRQTASKTTNPDDDTEKANLKNDLALQRLLKESHLLDPSSFSASSTPSGPSEPSGKTRLKALDLRLQALGAKTSVLRQEKMPLSHRTGIEGKTAQREAKRRREAAENGIVLEKARTAVRDRKRRERGVGAPGVGRMRGGTLKLSRRDVAGIQGSQGRGRGGKKGARR